MSILSALKTKGAKGKNIEEAVKTLPLGGGSGILIVNMTVEDDKGILDKSWQQINDAVFAIALVNAGDNRVKRALLTSIATPVEEGDEYNVSFTTFEHDACATWEFTADSPDEHPWVLVE